MTRAERIRRLLTEAFQPTRLEVIDDSAKHAGHAGAAPGGETHFSVLIVSERFSGLSAVSRHRAVNGALAAEFDLGLHALSQTTRTPDEQAGSAGGSAQRERV